MADLIRLRNRLNGGIVNVDEATAGQLGASVWEPVEGSAGTTAADGAFDPGKHNVDEVTAYLADADDDERARVIASETDGKNRKSIAEWEPAPADDE